MQTSQIRSTNALAHPVVGVLWLGLGAVVAGLVTRPASADASGPSLTVGLLTLFVAATVATYSLRYMRADPHATGFFARLAALVAAVLTVLYTGNLIVLGIAWCASGWILAGLIGHNPTWHEAGAAGRRARLAFLVGDAALLGALGILGWQAGSLQIDVALAGAPMLSPILATAAALLLVVAAAARCAQPPFCNWLLSSMTAPTPVSAVMHAGLVNAGGFLLIRFAPLLEASSIARLFAIAVGLGGAIYGIGIMIVRPDIKRSLAGSTVSQMGFMILTCGLGAYAAALWHIVAHGLFKAWLFLGSGSAIGMKPRKPAAPLTGGTAMVAAAAAAGAAIVVLSSGAGSANSLPLLLGFATAIAALTLSLRAQTPMRTNVMLVLTLVALFVLHASGLALAEVAIGHDAAPPAPKWAVLTLLAAFLGTWIWQQRMAAGRGLPLALYVRLINAGTLSAGHKGEQQ